MIKLIKGFFQSIFTTATEDVEQVKSTQGVLSLINNSGLGLESGISASDKGVLSLITSSTGVLSMINSTGQGINSPIDNTGQGVEALL